MWSEEPFGNDTAGDWAWELDDATDWLPVERAFTDVLGIAEVDGDSASIAIAAAEVVAHGLGRPTQDDSYTESVSEFIGRVATPPTSELRELALRALAAASGPGSELTELWSDDPGEWNAANKRLRLALQGTD